MSGWTVRGTTNDITTCELCGKVELRGTVHLITEDGEEIFAGTTCAARKVGTTAAKMRGAVDAAKMHAEIIEDAFCSYFRKIHGHGPREHAKQGDAAEFFVKRTRDRWMSRNKHV